MTARPDSTEAAEYYFKYIDQVAIPAGGSVTDVLAGQLDEAGALFDGLTDERAGHRYAPGKWSIRQVVSHVNDTERVFAYRAFWFARGLDGPLPSFDEGASAARAGADARSWASHVEEFRTVRAATLTLFRHLPADAWARGGVASGNRFSVRALAWITAGHAAHHLRLLRERYLA